MKIFITPTKKKKSLKIFLLKETSGFMPRSQAFEKSLNISIFSSGDSSPSFMQICWSAKTTMRKLSGHSPLNKADVDVAHQLFYASSLQNLELQYWHCSKHSHTCRNAGNIRRYGKITFKCNKIIEDTFQTLKKPRKFVQGTDILCKIQKTLQYIHAEGSRLPRAVD